jgi:hypothetical protein
MCSVVFSLRMKMLDVALGSREEVVHTKDFMSVRQWTVYQIGTEKPGSPCY